MADLTETRRDLSKLSVEELFDVECSMHAKLFDSEEWWRDRQTYLLSKGYQLRPRCRPGWTPSWVKEPTQTPWYREDWSPFPGIPHGTDATRISDGKLVFIKRIRTGDNEIQIATMLHRAAVQAQVRSHCVPILDVFQDEVDPQITYMVMPLLRPVNSPEFCTVENVVDFLDQVLEGLMFIHSQGVAHRDCAESNIMMDGDALFPRGFHPIQRSRLPDCSDWAPQRSRAATPVTYFFIDYDLAVYIPHDVYPKLTVGQWGRDREVPELSLDVPYNPFKVDVFILGNLFKKEFYNSRSSFEYT